MSQMSSRIYSRYLAVVVKAWAERPESSDEENESESDEAHHKKRDKEVHKRTKSLWKKRSFGVQHKKQSVKPPLRETHSNPLVLSQPDIMESEIQENSAKLVRERLKLQ